MTKTIVTGGRAIEDLARFSRILEVITTERERVVTVGYDFHSRLRNIKVTFDVISLSDVGVAFDDIGILNNVNDTLKI
ncbi:hypothetical protein PanWU01x14_053690 [Parasponia andersonii]|uniref:Uncharacterized protein n=1 Tax=Parasponia andersonii TaxID=3476 RepID=A0A2P5DLI6_PARAD|nr:hypothetical protein PanWU01x14_053690 [Parasponia andersonii]